MVLADWIFIGGILVSLGLGALIGFGKGISVLTKGIVGIIISVFVCYCFGGFILHLSFVQNLLERFASLWNGSDNFFCRLATSMRLEIIVYYVVLFFIVQLLRVIIVKILASVGKTNLIPIKIINKILGAALIAAVAMVLFLFAFQIIYWAYGADSEFALNFTAKLSGVFHLDSIYLNNPLASIVKYVQSAL